MRLPLIPVFLLYTLGLYLGHFDLPISSERLFVLLLILLVLWILFLILRKAAWGSWTAFACFLLLGILSLHLYLHPPDSPSPISQFTGGHPVSLEGIVDRPPEYTPGETRLTIRSEKVIVSDRHTPVEGRLLLFLKEERMPVHMGDRLRISCRLQPPHGFRNPGGFSYERHLTFERISTIGFATMETGWAGIGEGFKNPLLLKVEDWRDHIRQFLTREAPFESSSVLQALILGEQGNIPDEIKDHFVVTGIAHLLAISGDHLAIVALLSFSLLTWALKRSEYLLLTLSVRKWAAGLTIPWIVLYTFIAGGGISVIRATLMVITFLLSILFDRERNLLHTLAVAAFLILIFSPPSLFDVSFQLSFLAVLSILYLVPRILKELKGEGMEIFPIQAGWKEKIWKYVKLSFLVTVVATLGTAPFVVLHFNRISPIGLVTNLFAIPWVGFFIVPFTMIASLLSFFCYPLASLLIHLNGFLTLILLKAVAFFASFPYASVFVSTPTLLEVLLFYFLLATVIHLRRRPVLYLFLGLSVLLACDLAFWGTKDLFKKDLTLTFVDVGHGDCVLVEFPKGQRMLIDGGGLHGDRLDIGRSVIAPFLWKKKIRRIDYLVLTHPDPDHLKGLNFVASHFSIGQFWDSGLKGNSEFYSQLVKTLSSKRVERISWNKESPSQTVGGVQVSFLNPPVRRPSEKENQNPSFLNNHSLVMKLRLRNISILLAGDIEQESEYRMMREGTPLKAHLLKIPHHGSNSSSTSPFIERVRPAYAVLSVGERNMGRLPHPEVLRRYHQFNTEIFRTDQHGAITAVTDGEKIEVRPFVTR